MNDDEITAYIDKMVADAREILRADRVLSFIKGQGSPAPSPDVPPAPKPKPVPSDPAPKPRHWFFGETE